MDNSVTSQMNLDVGYNSYNAGALVGGSIGALWRGVSTFYTQNKQVLMTLLVICILVLLVYISVVSTQSLELNELDADALKLALINGMWHRSCQNTGGCGPKCPHISSNDPRVAIQNHAGVIGSIYALMKQLYGDEQLRREQGFMRIPEEMRKEINIDIDGFAKQQEKYLGFVARCNDERGAD